MTFAIHQHLKVLEDEFEIRNVLGFDFNLRVLSKSSRAYQKWLRKVQASNPIVVEMQGAVAKLGLAKSLSGQKLTEEDLTRALESAADKLNITGEQLDVVFRTQINEVCFLIRDWSGAMTLDPKTGKPNECNDDTKLELLEDVSEIPEGTKHGEFDYGGWGLGAALIHIVQSATNERLEHRGQFLVTEGKASGPTSGGTSEGGPQEPSTAAG